MTLPIIRMIEGQLFIEYPPTRGMFPIETDVFIDRFYDYEEAVNNVYEYWREKQEEKCKNCKQFKYEDCKEVIKWSTDTNSTPTDYHCIKWEENE